MVKKPSKHRRSKHWNSLRFMFRGPWPCTSFALCLNHIGCFMLVSCMSTHNYLSSFAKSCAGSTHKIANKIIQQSLTSVCQASLPCPSFHKDSSMFWCVILRLVSFTRGLVIKEPYSAILCVCLYERVWLLHHQVYSEHVQTKKITVKPLKIKKNTDFLKHGLQ